jgi:hypothetical protein
MLDAPVAVSNVSDQELDTIRGLFAVWREKLPRNLLRSTYYDGRAPLKDLGIAIPPTMRRLDVVLGWPEKAVRALASRNIWDGFVAPGAEQDPFGLADVLDANRFDLELPQAIVSAYKHSCAFISTTLGDTRAGDPEVVVMARSAEWSAATWDRNRRVIKAALAITDADDRGDPTGFIVYLPDFVLTCTRSAGRWVADRQTNPLGVVLVEPLTYDPQLDRPFGRSRITRAVMDITDRAARTILRTEISAEFYASPQRYILGADEEAWSGTDKWKAVMGRFLALTKDEDGDTPTVGQFQQMTMQPHLDMLRQLAGQFAGETGVPISSLGIVQDNPSSAEAIYAAKEDLIVEAQAANRIFGAALGRVAQRVVQLRDGLDQPTSDLRRIQARWNNPAFPSPVSAADALVKIATVFPWLGDSEVALERAGFTQPEITRLLSDKRRAQSTALVAGLAGGAPDPAALKAKFDALGVAIRAGVSPASAAEQVGLSGVDFTGAVPTSLRLPAADAAPLEGGAT